MPRISKAIYTKAAIISLEKAGFKLSSCYHSRFIADKGELRLYVDVSGRNLPYFGSNGKEAFFWETHIKADRLDSIEKEAMDWKAAPWIAYSYVILDPEFKTKFRNLISIQNQVFGIKMISTADFRKHSQPRSPNSWDAIELPRKDVLKLAIEPEEIKKEGVK